MANSHVLNRITEKQVFGVPAWICSCGRRFFSAGDFEKHTGE